MLKDGPDGAIGSTPGINNYFSDLPSFEQLTILVSHNDYVYVVTRKSGFPRNISKYISLITSVTYYVVK